MEERLQKQLAAAEEAIRADMCRQLLHQRLALIERLEPQKVPAPAKPAPFFALEAAADPADVMNRKLLAGNPAKQQPAHHAGWSQEEADLGARPGHRGGAVPASPRDKYAHAAEGAQRDPR